MYHQGAHAPPKLVEIQSMIILNKETGEPKVSRHPDGTSANLEIRTLRVGILSCQVTNETTNVMRKIGPRH